MGVGKIVDQKVTPLGKALSQIFFSFVVLRFAPWMSASFFKWIYDFFANRMFSYALAEAILGFDLVGISSQVGAQHTAYLQAYAKAEVGAKDPNLTKEQLNALANEVMRTASDLLALRKL
jgi:hypothetical protein